MAKETQVVEELLDSITKHSIELQRVANKMQGAVAKEFSKLSNELDGIVRNFDPSTIKNVSKRKAAMANVIKQGNEAIKKSNLAMARVVKDKLIDVGNLETKFSTGSINKAVTGKGTVTFATETVPAKKISTMADNLIIKGAPQKAMWARQSVALQNKFSDVIRNGWLNNQSIGTISQNIRGTAAAGFNDGIMNVSRHHANSLARTSISSISNQVREETYIANSDVVEGVQFLAVLDSDTTRVCRAHSGDKWKYTPAGWINVHGGHDYVQPPLHFNCRSTTIPLVFPASVLAKTVPAKLALVPKDRVRSMGMPLPPGLRKAKDADEWLKTQPVEYQHEVLGKAFDGWVAGRVSFKKFVTQKGRVRSIDEMEKIYAAEKLIPKEVSPLISKDRFKTYAGSEKQFADELKNISKEEFYAIEKKLLLGQTVTETESVKFGIVLRNAAPSELEFSTGFAPKNFSEFLGNSTKRLAFYNHIAKNFEKRVHGDKAGVWAKGVLEKRNTGRLDVKGKEIDQGVVDELREKIVADKFMSVTNKKILLEMFDEARLIVGSRRSLPMIESLFTIARKADFDDIDKFVPYINNSMTNSINSYFARLKRVEVRTTLSPEKIERYSTLSKHAKDLRYADLNRVDVVSRAEVGEVRRGVIALGKREVRDYEGGVAKFNNVDLELPIRDEIQMYLKYLSDDVRMSDKEIKNWMKRIRPVESRARMTKVERIHLERVEFIIKRTQAGDTVMLTDAILKNPLFKDWADEVWKGRGFSTAIRSEVGEALGDAQLYQNVKAYLKYKKGADQLDDIIKEAHLHSTIAGEKKLIELGNLKGKKLKEYVAQREARVNRKLDTDDVAERRAAQTAREKRVKEKREEVKSELEKHQADVLLDLNTSFRKMTKTSLRDPKSPFYTEASKIPHDIEYGELAQFVNARLYDGVRKGKQYISVAKNMGEDFYAQYRTLVGVTEDDMIRMGHYLIEGAVRTKLVKRVKEMTRILDDAQRPKDVLSWRLVATNERWKDSFLALKTNYGVDGLPYVGKAPKLGRDGFYSDGRASIRGTERKWLEEKAKLPSSKRWMDNLQDEADTGIRVNAYIFDVMEELEKRGRTVIPKPPKNSKDLVARSKYDSYIRAKNMARGLRDEKFYNRMSNDKFARTYADTTALQWQGDDINRGLMMFDRGVKLGTTGEADFARNFMNYAGFDKIPMKDRLLLMRKLDEDLILKTARDPIKNDWWFTERSWLDEGIFTDLNGISKSSQKLIKEIAIKGNPADEGAFQFLAMIEERAKMIQHVRNGGKIDDFISHLPSQRDGTTNVLQHLGGISRDKNIAFEVNMVKRDEVADAYLKLRNKIDEIVDTLPDDIKKWIDVPGGLKPADRRKSVKKALMTAQYNAGARTLGESYFEALSKVEIDGVKIFEKALKSKEGKKVITKLGKILMEETEKLFPEATKVRKALNVLAEAHQISARNGVKNALAIEYNAPGTQFPFRQQYQIESTRPIKLSVGDKGEKMTLNVNQVKAFDEIDYDDIDWAKQNRAFAPNIIHMMDATHKSLVVEALKKSGIKDFSMIHDSFGAHFGNMDLLLKETKIAFLELYKDKNFLKILVDDFKSKGIEMKKFQRTDKGMRIRGDDGEWLVENIDLEDMFRQGDYNFDEFMELEYFFH